MSEMIERVARAIAQAVHPGVDCWRSYQGVAKHAIAAMREPDRAMWAAGGDAIVGKTAVHHDDVLTKAWQAMIDAALEEPLP